MACSLGTMSWSCLSWSACHGVEWLVLWGPCHGLACRGLLVMVWNGLFFGGHVMVLLVVVCLSWCGMACSLGAMSLSSCHCVEWFLWGPWDGLTCHGVEWFVLWGSWHGSLLVLMWNSLFFGGHVVGLLAIGVEWVLFERHVMGLFVMVWN